MKVMTILGTRPEIIRLSEVIRRLDQQAEHVLVHTGQNFDPGLSDCFFSDLEVREPDEYLGVRASGFGEQIGKIIEQSEVLLRRYRPDRLLILGDTNSGLSAIVAKRLGVTVFHMEAGNRCFDDRVPEEVNRRVIDHSSSVLMPYTERSRANLLAEGISRHRIFVTGNPIKEVLDRHHGRVAASDVLTSLQLAPQRYFLVTAHRAENVDHEARLRGLVQALAELHAEYRMPVIVSTHPRTRLRLDALGIAGADGVQFAPPFGFFDFVRLERDAFCVLSDSGTVQEETCIMKVPNVTIRDVTERPETIECGSGMLSGVDPASLRRAVAMVTSGVPAWTPPAEYLATNVSDSVCRILLGARELDAAERDWQTHARA